MFKIVLGGDFNEILDEELDSRNPAYYPVKTEKFNAFVEETGLSDVWRAFHPEEIRYTHNKGRRLDRFLVSDLLFNYCFDADIGVSYRSDHSPIYLEVIINRNEAGPGLFRFPDFLCTDDKFKELLKLEVDNFRETNVKRILPHQW